MKRSAFVVPAVLASLICGVTSGQATPQSPTWGNISGQITVQGDLPEPSPERVGRHKDRPVCLVDGKVPADDGLAVSEAGGLRDVFVILVPASKAQSIPVHPSYDEAAATEASKITLDNVNCRFVPHAIAVRTGQALTLKNSDAVGHNCKITSFNNEHNINLPAGGAVEIKLEHADRIPANVACDIHPWMDAVLLVKDHPYVAITAADGSFEMKNVPAGDWLLQFWHQKGGYLRKLVVASKKVDRRGRVKVTVANQQTFSLGEMKLPAAALKQ